MYQRDDGILSHKSDLNQMVFKFQKKIEIFSNLFQLQIILENARLIQEGIIKSQDQLKELSLTSDIIKKHYKELFGKKNIINMENNYAQYVDQDFRSIQKLYENIASLIDIEILSFIEKVNTLKENLKQNFSKESQEIKQQCQKLINMINGKYHTSDESMLKLITRIYQNLLQNILQINQQQYFYFKMIDCPEFLISQIQYFVHIYDVEFDFRGYKLAQLTILLQYFEMFLDNQLQKHQLIEVRNFQAVENVRNPQKIDQALLIYADNLKEEFDVKFMNNNKITQDIRIQIRSIFKSELVQKIMKDIELQFNLPIDFGWEFLPQIKLIIIPNCDFKGCTLRDNGVYINLTPFLIYTNILYAYCILVAISGWNCQQLIKKNKKSFYWYDHNLQYLDMDQFIFYKRIFGITEINDNKQLFSLQFLNQDTAKVILSIGEYQYTYEELHHLFRLFSCPQLQQTGDIIRINITKFKIQLKILFFLFNQF
ncbi:hypothetical protein pb186bvf_002610 [Paramecium bursaria]